MKAKLLVTMMLVLSTLAAKAGVHDDAKVSGDLITFKNMVSAVYDQANQEANSMRDRAYRYNAINYFKYGQRYAVISENCEATKLLAVGLLMIGTTIEVTRHTLETAPMLQTPEADAHFQNLYVYINGIKAANDQCGRPTKSLIELRKAIAGLGDVKAFLESLPLD